MSKKPNLDELLLVEILRTSNLLAQPMTQVFKDFDLTQAQYNILRILRGASPEPISAGTIKERMINPKSDVTRLLDRLVSKGLVNRVICPENRRQMNITISCTGMDMLDQVAPVLSGLLRHYQKEAKCKDETRAFLNYLERIQQRTVQILEEKV